MADDNDDAAEKTGEPTIQLLDSENTPTIFVDGIHGMQIRDGVLSLNLTRNIFGVPKSNMDGTHTEAVARLKIPLNAYLRIVKFAYNSLSLLQKMEIITEKQRLSITDEKKDDA